LQLILPKRQLPLQSHYKTSPVLIIWNKRGSVRKLNDCVEKSKKITSSKLFWKMPIADHFIKKVSINLTNQTLHLTTPQSMFHPFTLMYGVHIGNAIGCYAKT
jgi:hypothetical protein